MNLSFPLDSINAAARLTFVNVLTFFNKLIFRSHAPNFRLLGRSVIREALCRRPPLLSLPFRKVEQN